MTVADTSNDYIISVRENLPNHSMSLMGLGKFVRQSLNEIPTFRTKQEAYRYAAWIITLADVLPDEKMQPDITFEEVLAAVKQI